MEKLSKNFSSLEGDQFNPVKLFSDIERALPALRDLFELDWRIEKKFFEQCEVADPTFNRREITPRVQSWLARAVDSLPNELLDVIYHKCWGSRIWHSSDWKLIRYLEKWDLDAVLEDIIPFVYVSFFIKEKARYYNYHPACLQNSILSKMRHLIDDCGVFRVIPANVMSMAKAIVWWCHDPVVVEEFKLLRSAIAQDAEGRYTRELIHNALVRLVMCAAGTTTVWVPDLRDE